MNTLMVALTHSPCILEEACIRKRRRQINEEISGDQDYSVYGLLNFFWIYENADLFLRGLASRDFRNAFAMSCTGIYYAEQL